MRVFFPFFFFFCFLFSFLFCLGWGWEIWVFKSYTHSGTETQYCKEEGLQLPQTAPWAARKGRRRWSLSGTGSMLSGGDQDSPVWTYWGAKQRFHGMPWVSCRRGRSETGVERDWPPDQAHWAAVHGSVAAGPGEVWAVVVGGAFGLMDLDSTLEEPAVSDAVTSGRAFADSP